MDQRASLRNKDVALLAVAAVAAAVVVPVMMPLGLPLAALALAWLSFAGKRGVAIAVSLAGGAAVAVLDPVYGVLTAVVLLAAGPLASVLLRSWRAWRVTLLVAVIAFVAIVGAEAARAALVGSDLVTETRRQVSLVAKSWTESLAASSVDSGAVEDLEDLRLETVHLMMMMWPSTYMMIAALSAVLAVRSAVFAARKRGMSQISLAPLREVDLPWHVVWPVIAGLALLAYARGTNSPDGLAEILGVNLMLVSGGLLLVQGAAVASGLYARLESMENTVPLRTTLVVGLLAMIVLAAPLLFGMFGTVGLADFWANFRRLPRDGEEQPRGPLEPMSKSGTE